MTRRLLGFALVCHTLLAAGCVTQGKYDQSVHDANAVRGELAAERARLLDEERRATSDRAALQKQLDDETAIDAQLRAELAKVGANARSLLAANGNLAGALEGSQRRLEELRRAQAAAEARAALFADLARKLKAMVDAGDLAIVLRDGRMVLRLSNDVLFDSGRAELKPAGTRALTEIAAVLRTIPQRSFQVAGHTDDQPIRLSPYRSNWELSAERALEVTRFLIVAGVEPGTLSAAGYGEFDPVDDNGTREGRAHNRRTEIALQPNIDEIVALPTP